MDARFVLYKDRKGGKGEWRWRLKAENGETIADSAEGYIAKEDALHGIELVKTLSQKVPTVEVLGLRGTYIFKTLVGNK